MQAPADTLHTPHREFFATTNAWAFLHWLRFIHGIELTGWAALQRFSAAEPAGCRDAIIRFAGAADGANAFDPPCRAA